MNKIPVLNSGLISALGAFVFSVCIAIIVLVKAIRNQDDDDDDE
jgi:hypothetical protein